LKAALETQYPEYLTTGIVARHCGVSKVTVLRWIEQGELTAFRLPGNQNRIHRDDFYAFAAKYNIPIEKCTSTGVNK
jgi:excisionase family DNA binding protein